MNDSSASLYSSDIGIDAPKFTKKGFLTKSNSVYVNVGQISG